MSICRERGLAPNRWFFKTAPCIHLNRGRYYGLRPFGTTGSTTQRTWELPDATHAHVRTSQGPEKTHTGQHATTSPTHTHGATQTHTHTEHQLGPGPSTNLNLIPTRQTLPGSQSKQRSLAERQGPLPSTIVRRVEGRSVTSDQVKVARATEPLTSVLHSRQHPTYINQRSNNSITQPHTAL